jgi:pilus assembly protein Flp/PilA
MKSLISRFVKDESGATAIEYGLIAGILSVGIAAILPEVRNRLVGAFTTIQNALPAAAAAPPA